MRNVTNSNSNRSYKIWPIKLVRLISLEVDVLRSPIKV